MKYILAAGLICASTFVGAGTWKEAFDEAVEKKSKPMCESTYERMDSKCNLAGIYRGGQDARAVSYCKSEAKSLKKKCISSIDENAETEAEEAAEKRAESEKAVEAARERAENAAARKQELADIAAISRGRTADFELSCTRVSAVRTKTGNFTYDPITFFDQVVAIQIYNAGACYGSLGAVSCSVTPGTIIGYSHSKGRFAISRVTGTMSISDRHDLEATYTCQKVTAATNKF